MYGMATGFDPNDSKTFFYEGFNYYFEGVIIKKIWDNSRKQISTNWIIRNSYNIKTNGIVILFKGSAHKHIGWYEEAI